MIRVWYNHGYSQTRDALVLLRRPKGTDLFLIATHSNAMAAVFLEADMHEVEPVIAHHTPEGQPLYVDWCLDFCAQHGVDVFVVQRGRNAVARRHAEFEAAGVKLVLVADAETLDIIDDKARFYAACSQAGLPTPLVYDVNTLADFDQACMAIREEGHDVCIKPPYDIFGNGYWRLRDNVPLLHQLMNPHHREIQTAVVRQAFSEADVVPRLLVMQYLPGPEWSVDCLCRDGKLLTGVARRKSGSHQVLETDGAAMDLARVMAETFNLSHLANIQVRRAGPDDALPYVLEINPRMSGGCLYAEMAGLNLPHLQLLNALGRLPDQALPTPHSVAIAAVHGVVDLKASLVDVDYA